MGLQTGRSRARQVPQGCLRGAVSLSSPRRPGPEPPEEVVLVPSFFGDHLAQPVWSGPPWSSPYVPCSRPWVNRSRIPSTHSVFRLLPEAARARDRKFGRPPRTHPLSRLQAESGPAGARFGTRGRRATWFAAQGSAPGPKAPRSPTSHSSSLGLRGSEVCKARKNGVGSSSRDVTASPQRRMGSLYLSAETCTSCNGGERERSLPRLVSEFSVRRIGKLHFPGKGTCRT